MIYILDTNIIRKLLFHFPKKGKVFEDIWTRLEAGIEEGKYISVDECFNELSRQFSKDNDAFKWVSERKHMFKNPDSAETLIIRELFKDRKMRESIHTKNILSIAVLKITAHNHTHENTPYNPTHGSPQMLLQRLLIKVLLHELFVFSYMP